MSNISSFWQGNYDNMFNILKNNDKAVTLLNELWEFLNIILELYYVTMLGTRVEYLLI